MPITAGDNYWSRTTLNCMVFSWRKRLGIGVTLMTCTSWKHGLSVLLLLEPDSSQKSISHNLRIENSKIEF